MGGVVLLQVISTVQFFEPPVDDALTYNVYYI